MGYRYLPQRRDSSGPQAKPQITSLADVTLVLLVMAGLTRWLLLVVQDGDEDRQVLPDARSDYTLEEFDLLVMNRQGDPSFRIESPYLEKSPVDESVSLIQPLVFLFDGKALNSGYPVDNFANGPFAFHLNRACRHGDPGPGQERAHAQGGRGRFDGQVLGCIFTLEHDEHGTIGQLGQLGPQRLSNMSDGS